jgi:2-dehydropantoate 2-reductase
MRIAVFGAGGVGGYFGACLAAAGEDVRFLARGRHLRAICERGLRVRSANGNLQIEPARATDDPAAIGPVNWVLITVKLYGTDAAVAALPPLLGPETAVVSLQNGVGAATALAAALGGERVAGGTTYIMSTIAEPGVIDHMGTMARLVIGEFDRRRSPRLEALATACERAGIDVRISDDINLDIWTKFTFLAPVSGITSLARLPLGPLREDADTRALLRAAFEEAVAVAGGQGVHLPNDQVARHLATVDGLPAEMGSSMLYDLLNGRRLELPWLSGTVCRLGREAGIPTPTHAAVWAALKLHAAGGEPAEGEDSPQRSR